MEIIADPTWVFSVLLLAIRTAAIFFLTPLDALGRMPLMVRIMFSLTVAVLMVESLDIKVSYPASAVEAVSLAVGEVILGLAFIFAVHAVLAVFSVAGRLIDYQSGFSAAGIFNPAMGEMTPLYGTFLSLLFTVLFFLADGHLLLLSAFGQFVQVAPPGTSLSQVSIDSVVAAFGYVFSAGLVISLPIVITLLIMDLGIGVMSRSMPQMNVYFLFLPLKIFVAAVMVWVLLGGMHSIAINQLDWLYDYWSFLLQG